MAGKVRHLKERSGRYSARLVVPKQLRPIVGKAELETQLGPDRRQALMKLPAAVAALQDKIALAARRMAEASGHPVELGRYPLSPTQMAKRDYQAQIAFDSEIRSAYHQYAGFEVDYEEGRRYRDGFAGKLSDDELDALVGHRIERFKFRGNHTADKGTVEWRTIAQGLCVAAYEAMTRQDERNAGNFSGRPSHPSLTSDETDADDPSPVSLRGLLTDYLKERAVDGKGREAGKRWSPVFADLAKFIGHDDASKITKKNLLDWKDARLQTLATKTVADVYLASVRTVFKWAVNNDRITSNEAENVRLTVSKKQRSREQGFTLDEALVVLRIARNHEPRHSANPQTREAPQTTAAKRWAPILCALTGARIAEITQLRKQDFRFENGIPFVRIAPEAGSVKTGSYRDVPLHAQLLDLGLMDMVQRAVAGPLFYPLSKNKPGPLPARTVAGRVSKWLQSKQAIPEGVSPNHGWRHRFKTVGREVGIEDRTLDAIQGHAPKTAGDSYGDVTIVAKRAAIDKIPRYSL